MTTATLDRPITRTNALHGAGVDVHLARGAHSALIVAKLAGWRVVKEPVTAPSGTQVPNVYCLTRENGRGKPLRGVSVGPGYTVVQYEENADLLDAVARHTGATFHASGALGQGERAFVSMNLPNKLMIGDDPLDAYIVAFMGHGKFSNVFAPTAIRTWCANQQRAITRGNQFTVTLRHTKNIKERMAVAEKTLTETVKGLKAYQKAGMEMLSQPLVDAQFQEIVSQLYPLGGDSLTAQTRFDNRMQEMRRLFNESQTTENIRGTVWAGFQAVSEWQEHYSTVRGGDGDSITSKRAQRALISSTFSAEQIKAFDAFRELVK